MREAVSFYVRDLPRVQWRKCPMCGGSGTELMVGDAHRSEGIVPCRYPDCCRGTIKTRHVYRVRAA